MTMALTTHMNIHMPVPVLILIMRIAHCLPHHMELRCTTHLSVIYHTTPLTYHILSYHLHSTTHLIIPYHYHTIPHHTFTAYTFLYSWAPSLFRCPHHTIPYIHHTSHYTTPFHTKSYLSYLHCSLTKYLSVLPITMNTHMAVPSLILMPRNVSLIIPSLHTFLYS